MHLFANVIFFSILVTCNGMLQEDFCQPAGSNSSSATITWKAEFCSQYYKCEAGQPQLKSCPFGLYFNNGSNLCDWPGNVTCQLTQSEADTLALPDPPAFIYLTFDDGPGGGTDETLDLLKEEGVKATFFILAGNLRSENVDSRASFARTVREGHVIGDHSFDHMGHNSPDGSGIGAYLEDVEKNAAYFGKRCVDAAMEAMEAAGMTAEERAGVSRTMFSFARMPYSNNWRFPNRIRSDCTGCTVPPESSYMGNKLADLLEKNGQNVVGWDYGWPTDYGKNLYTKNAKQVLMMLTSARSKQEDKLVVLTHDKMHNLRQGEHGEYNLQQLRLMVRLAKGMGYQFRTMDKYLTDGSARFGADWMALLAPVFVALYCMVSCL